MICPYCVGISESVGTEYDTDHDYPGGCNQAEAQWMRDGERENPIPAGYAEP